MISAGMSGALKSACNRRSDFEGGGQRIEFASHAGKFSRSVSRSYGISLRIHRSQFQLAHCLVESASQDRGTSGTLGDLAGG